jgi:hypothetical protein
LNQVLLETKERLIIDNDIYLVKFLEDGDCRHENHRQGHDAISMVRVETLVADLWESWRNALRVKLASIPEDEFDIDRDDLKAIVAIADRVDDISSILIVVPFPPPGSDFTTRGPFTRSQRSVVLGLAASKA